MIQKIKNIIIANRLLRTLIIPLVDKSIQYNICRLLKKPFDFKLVNGRSIKIYPKGQIAFEIFTKKFEKQEIDLFQRIIKDGMSIVDAGANIGLYSLIASQIVGSKGIVFSYEPSKETFHRFSENIKLNKCSNIKSLNKGLGDKINEKLILRQDVGYEDAERYVFPNNQAPDFELKNINAMQVEEEVIIDTLDNSLENFNVKKIDFLKIDTEGYEYYILKGAIKILINSPEVIILMECTALGTARASTTQKEIFSFLKDLDLKIFYWDKNLADYCDNELGILNAGNVWVCRNKNQLTL